MIITIDGPAGVGKSTVAKFLAAKLKYSYFDTGAMYRTVTYALIKNRIDLEDEDEVKNFLNNQFKYEIKENKFDKLYFLNGEDVTQIIRSNYISSLVSLVSSKKYIREALLPFQRKFAEDKDIICEGRDMGTVVFPDADFKFYLTARVSIRAERRFQELIKKYPQDIATLDKNKILEEIQKRDELDTKRKESPLKKAKDAYLIDTSNLTIQKVVKKILKTMKKRKKMKIILRLAIFFSWLVLKVFYRLKVYGRENLLKKAAIIVSNHTSFLDPSTISAAINEEMHFLARESLFKVFILKNLLRHLNTYPISEKGSNIQTIKTIMSVLKNGQKVLLFPEGTRSLDGKLAKLMPGVAYIINLAKCDVIPAYIHGTFEIWGKKRKFPKAFGKVSCVFGKPIKFDEFESIGKEHRTSYILNRVESAMRDLERYAEERFKKSSF